MKNLLKCVPLLLALTACQDDSLTDYIVDDAPDLPVIATWNSTLAPLPARPQASGALELGETGSYMLLDLTAQGLHPDSSYYWQLYFGTCASRIARYGVNAVPPAYPIFKANASGAGSAEATVMGRLKADSTYSLRIFIPRTIGSTADTTFYACGDLQRN